MVMFRFLLLALCLMASPAHAQEKKLDGDGITRALPDKTLAGTDGGKQWTQLFRTGGLTVYTIDGNSSNGRWTARGDQYCSQWPPNETWACYDVTVDGKTITFISSSGRRFPGSSAD